MFQGFWFFPRYLFPLLIIGIYISTKFFIFNKIWFVRGESFELLFCIFLYKLPFRLHIHWVISQIASQLFVYITHPKILFSNIFFRFSFCVLYFIYIINISNLCLFFVIISLLCIFLPCLTFLSLRFTSSFLDCLETIIFILFYYLFFLNYLFDFFFSLLLFIKVNLFFFFHISSLSNLFLCISFLFLGFLDSSRHKIWDFSYFWLLIEGKKKFSITAFPIIKWS